MDEKTKLYVFKRSEIFLIFGFILTVSILTFILGVKVGKEYSYQQSGFTGEDQQRVELLSKQEELGEQLTKEMPKEIDQAAQERIKELTRDRLEQEIEKSKEPEAFEEKKEIAPPKEVSSSYTPIGTTDTLSGKYTIQLHATKVRAEAEHFAKGFSELGYSPIIKEIELESGLWYRIYLGIYDSMEEAKNFMVKNSSLFKGRDYLIKRFE